MNFLKRIFRLGSGQPPQNPPKAVKRVAIEEPDAAARTKRVKRQLWAALDEAQTPRDETEAWRHAWRTIEDQRSTQLALSKATDSDSDDSVHETSQEGYADSDAERANGSACGGGGGNGGDVSENLAIHDGGFLRFTEAIQPGTQALVNNDAFYDMILTKDDKFLEIVDAEHESDTDNSSEESESASLGDGTELDLAKVNGLDEELGTARPLWSLWTNDDHDLSHSAADGEALRASSSSTGGTPRHTFRANTPCYLKSPELAVAPSKAPSTESPRIAFSFGSAGKERNPRDEQQLFSQPSGCEARNVLTLPALSLGSASASGGCEAQNTDGLPAFSFGDASGGCEANNSAFSFGPRTNKSAFSFGRPLISRDASSAPLRTRTLLDDCSTAGLSTAPEEASGLKKVAMMISDSESDEDESLHERAVASICDSDDGRMASFCDDSDEVCPFDLTSGTDIDDVDGEVASYGLLLDPLSDKLSGCAATQSFDQEDQENLSADSEADLEEEEETASEAHVVTCHFEPASGSKCNSENESKSEPDIESELETESDLESDLEFVSEPETKSSDDGDVVGALRKASTFALHSDKHTGRVSSDSDFISLDGESSTDSSSDSDIAEAAKSFTAKEHELHVIGDTSSESESNDAEEGSDEEELESRATSRNSEKLTDDDAPEEFSATSSEPATRWTSYWANMDVLNAQPSRPRRRHYRFPRDAPDGSAEKPLYLYTLESEEKRHKSHDRRRSKKSHGRDHGRSKHQSHSSNKRRHRHHGHDHASVSLHSSSHHHKRKHLRWHDE